MTWGGKLYETTSSITAADVVDFLTLDLSAFWALYDAVPADTSQSPTAPAVTYTCPSPCQGGTLQTRHIYVDPKHIKTKGIYVYGAHDLTINGSAHQMTTYAMHEIEVRASASIAERLLGIGFELLQDVGSDLRDRIVNWLRGLL